MVRLDLERAAHNAEVLEKCALTYLLSLLADKPVDHLPQKARESIFAKLREDQERLETGDLKTGRE